MSKHKNQFMDKYRCVLDSHKKKLGDNDTLFLDRIFAGGIGPYESRLKSLGFIGKAHVLDAGCGFGQWSLALSALNKQISACDISPLRIDFLREIISEANISNIAPLCSGIDKLPYSDNSFDVVFCYGVIFLTPWRKSLAELARVLKKNGVLYVNANGLGWYLFLWQEEHNKAKDYDPKSLAAKAFSDTLEYDRHGEFKKGMNVIIDSNDLENELARNGFGKIQKAGEGTLHIDSDTNGPRPFFTSVYRGQEAVYEAIAVKVK